MQSMQIAVRMSAETVGQLDALVQSGSYESRAAAVRAGIEVLVKSEEQARVGREIAEGYLRIPQNDEEAVMAQENLRRAIEDEPW